MITICIVIPTYNENENLPILLSDLKLNEHSDTAVLICDDSAEDIRDDLKKIIQSFNENISGERVLLSFGNLKSGRGAAVKRGLSVALENFSHCETFLECDADGSHAAKDIWNIALLPVKSDIVIGSRYVEQSRIIDWPLTRRFFSRALNVAIPKVFSFEISDITNGLRRYRRNAVEVITTTPSLTSDFLYLTEQLVILRKAGFSNYSEVPITFENRKRGTSSVTTFALVNAVRSLLSIFRTYGRN
jgi:dolichol-phosphate mannosyltransferase